jgi:hypothetical protein
MIHNDVQLGKPAIPYSATTSAIEGSVATEGMVAYSTDDNKLGWYDGSTWIWIVVTSSGSTILASNLLGA